MAYYCLYLSYDGNYFDGYAIQKTTNNTVQNKLESSLSILFKQPIKVVSAGRTDKGVCAIKQVISFKASFNISANSIKQFLNKNLKHMYVFEAKVLNKEFHARFDAKSKTYMYIINTGKFNLFNEPYIYQFNKKIDLQKLKQCSDLFVGKHDFLSFSTTELKRSIRTINWIKLYEKNNHVYILINGDGFLRNMVRIIVGVFLDYLENKKDLDFIKLMFIKPSKNYHKTNLSPSGLYLLNVIY